MVPSADLNEAIDSLLALGLYFPPYVSTSTKARTTNATQNNIKKKGEEAL